MLQDKPSANCSAHMKFNRLTLYITSRCNVGSNYCDEKTAKESDGVIKVASAKVAIEALRAAAKSDPRLRVVKIAGSGDPLGSPVTFEVLSKIREEFPYFTRSVATDGLLLPKKLELLKELGVNAITVNVNAVDATVGSQIYSYIRLNGKTLLGREAFEVLSINQLEGIRNAADAGMLVEVNAAYIPGVNSEHLVEVAKIVRSLGAYTLNIVPLASKRFAGLDVPSDEEMAQIRSDCEDVCVPEVVLFTPSALSMVSA
jgi:nitrogen fixation protein NifB